MSTVSRTAAGAPPLPQRVPEDQLHIVANRTHSMAIGVLRAARADDTGLGITPERLSVLSVLVYGGPTTLGRLARTEQVSPAAITRHVNALEREGLVTRTAVPGDRRAWQVHATVSGRRLVERGRRYRILRIAELLAGLGTRDLTALDRATTAVLAELH